MNEVAEICFLNSVFISTHNTAAPRHLMGRTSGHHPQKLAADKGTFLRNSGSYHSRTSMQPGTLHLRCYTRCMHHGSRSFIFVGVLLEYELVPPTYSWL